MTQQPSPKTKGLDNKFAIETLKALRTIWQRICHLKARIGDETMLFIYNGQAKQ